MNIPLAIASVNVRKSASTLEGPHATASWVRSIILVSIGNITAFVFPPCRTSCVRTWSALPRQRDLSASDCYSGGDLVERRVDHVKGFYLRWSLNNCGEDLGHFRISSAVVSLSILRFVPQTDSERFRAALAYERNFVLESFLFSKQGKHVLLQPLGKLCNAIGLQMHVNSACKHLTLLGSRCQGGNSDNRSWFR